MSTTFQVTCVNGHASPAGSRFCNTCGQPITNLANENRVYLQPADAIEADAAVLAPNRYAQPVSSHPAAKSNSAFCSGCGKPFEKGQYVCERCHSIKPLSVGHQVAPELFQWALDGKAMAKLRSIKPLVAVANQVSKQVGRPWIEANFNGVRLGPRQMPHVYSMAVQSARILGLPRMPSIYVSGTRPWDALTFGSNDDAFVVMGSALVSCFQKSDLMFLFAREMGHILAGHALWKTVIQFCLGEQRGGSSMMRNGVAGLLDPFKLVESAVELPLVAWARQSEITADRAGLLASGGLEQARRTLMMWSLRSPMLYQQINIQAWLEQQEEDAVNNNIRLAEAVTTSTPYLTRRLKLLQEYDATVEVKQFRHRIMSAYKTQKAEAQQEAETQKEADQQQPPTEAEEPKPVSFKCPACQKQISLPTDNLEGKTAIAVKCPNSECQKISRISIPKPIASPTGDAEPGSPQEFNESLSQMGG